MRAALTAMTAGLMCLAFAAPAGAAPPANTTPPSLSGPNPPYVGSVLTVVPGVWTGSPQLSYQWVTCPPSNSYQLIPDATQTSYAVAQSDLGNVIYVEEFPVNDVAVAGVASAAVGPVTQLPPPTGNPPANTKRPAVTGLLEVGSTLTVSNGVWTGRAPITFSYAWMRCNGPCAQIPGQTASTLTLTSAERGMVVYAVVTATNVIGSAQSASSYASEGVGVPGGGLVSVAQTDRLLRRASALNGRRATAGELLKDGGYPTIFSLQHSGEVDIVWTAPPTPGAKPVTVAAGHNDELLFNPGPVSLKVKIKLTAAGRRLLKADRHPTVTITASLELVKAPFYPVVVTETRTL